MESPTTQPLNEPPKSLIDSSLLGDLDQMTEAEVPLHHLLDKNMDQMDEAELREFVGRLRSARLSHQTLKSELADVTLEECEVEIRQKAPRKPKVQINIDDYV